MTTTRPTAPAVSVPAAAGDIDASWFAAAFRDTSPTWRRMYAEEALASGDLACDDPDVEHALADGWSLQAAALAASAWWLAEALWRNGVAGSVLAAVHLRRARQIGLAVLAVTPDRPPAQPAAAAWLASGLFDEPARTTIRLQLPRPLSACEEAAAHLMRQIAPGQVDRLVGYARRAMGA